MSTFVIVIFRLAMALAATYIFGLTPGEA